MSAFWATHRKFPTHLHLTAQSHALTMCLPSKLKLSQDGEQNQRTPANVSAQIAPAAAKTQFARATQMVAPSGP